MPYTPINGLKKMYLPIYITNVFGYSANAGTTDYRAAMLISFPIVDNNGNSISSLYDPHTEILLKMGRIYENDDGIVSYHGIDNGVGTSVFIIGYQ